MSAIPPLSMTTGLPGFLIVVPFHSERQMKPPLGTSILGVPESARSHPRVFGYRPWHGSRFDGFDLPWPLVPVYGKSAPPCESIDAAARVASRDVVSLWGTSDVRRQPRVWDGERADPAGEAADNNGAERSKSCIREGGAARGFPSLVGARVRCCHMEVAR